MGKARGKKLKNKGNPVKQTGVNRGKRKKMRGSNTSNNASVPTPSPFVDPAEVYVLTPPTNGSEAVAENRKSEKDGTKRLSGFIFMCNARTKPKCYQNHVFGLPAGGIDVVEKIKPGTKLFLFDFDLKLLYGVYEASSPGKLNLEPAAFGGKFPAQVRFKIIRDCIPLPEGDFKTGIKDNYQGPKFRQELTGKQVRNLLSLFRHFVAPPSVPLHPQVANVAPRWEMPPRPMDGQFKPALMPHFQNPYVAGRMHDPPPVMEPHHVQQNLVNLWNERHGTRASMGHFYPAAEPTIDHYRIAEAGRYGSSQTMQEPYRRYRTEPEIGRHQLAYNSYPIPVDPYASYGQLPVRPAREGSLPVSSYYSFAGAPQISHNQVVRLE